MRLAGIANRSANTAPGRPPSAAPRRRRSACSGLVRRAWASAKVGSRSQKIVRARRAVSQKKRRTPRRKATARPATGRSASVRT